MTDRSQNQQRTDAGHATTGGPKTSIQLLGGTIAMLVAAALLFSFYNVTQHAVARAHTHWAQAVQESGNCRPGADGCTTLGRSVTMEGMVVSHATR